MTEQVFDILTSITKKCYLMDNPQGFFDELMSPFLFLPLLEFTFEGGAHSKQGAEFLRLFFFNLFVAEPIDAELDLVDENNGFNNGVPRDDLDEESKAKPSAEYVNNLKEVGVMKDASVRRNQLLSDKQRIYQKSDM